MDFGGGEWQSLRSWLKQMVGNVWTLQETLRDMYSPGSLSWICLTASASLTFLSLFTIKTAILEGRRPITAVIFSTLAVVCCAGAMAAFLTTLMLESHILLKDLGWTFYTCCCSLAFGFTVTLFIGIQKQRSSIMPTSTITTEEFPMPTTVVLSDPTQAA